MKARSRLSASEVDALLADLGRRLEGVGIETQPEIAARVLDLVSDPRAGLRQFADVIKADPSLSGRMLRLSNSAFFAQRAPVTNLERACVLLGLERLKALSLGFYLSRAAAGDREHALSRRIWGEGVYRACLAAELARQICPARAPEAFVVGLMMDAGIPVLARLVGKPALAIVQSDHTPTKQFNAECGLLPYTHVDLVSAIVRRWGLPDLLSKPIERHHIVPGDGDPTDQIHLLHRVAYYVGAIRLDPDCVPEEAAPMPTTAQRLFGMTSDRVGEIVKRAAGEYEAMNDLFREVADSVGNMDDMAERVQRQLVEVMDRAVEDQMKSEEREISSSFLVAQQHVEIEVDRSGLAIAYLSDEDGNRLLSYSFRPGKEPTLTVLDALGVELGAPTDAAELDQYLRAIAA